MDKIAGLKNNKIYVSASPHSIGVYAVFCANKSCLCNQNLLVVVTIISENSCMLAIGYMHSNRLKFFQNLC